MAGKFKNTQGSSLKVCVEKVLLPDRRWSVVAVEYSIHDEEALKRAANVQQALRRLGFTAEPGYKPSPKGTVRMTFSKSGTARAEYSTWTAEEEQQNTAALKRLFKTLNMPWTVRQIQPEQSR